MTELEQLDKARQLAKEAHAGQVDRGGHSYEVHLATVASWCQTPLEQTVAWLHDILEDTAVDEAALREAGFSEEVITAVVLLTKHYSDDFVYREYLERIRENPLACAVKKCDLRHNMDTGRLQKMTEKDRLYQEKYRISARFLEGTLEEDYVFPEGWSRHMEDV